MEFGIVSPSSGDAAASTTQRQLRNAECSMTECTDTPHCTTTGKTTEDHVLDSHIPDTMSNTSYQYKSSQDELASRMSLTTGCAQHSDAQSNVYDTLSWDLLFQPWPTVADAAAAAYQSKTPLIAEILAEPSLLVMPAAMNKRTHHQD